MLNCNQVILNLKLSCEKRPAPLSSPQLINRYHILINHDDHGHQDFSWHQSHVLFQVRASASSGKLNTQTHTLASLKLHVPSAKNVAKLKEYTSLPTLLTTACSVNCYPYITQSERNKDVHVRTSTCPHVSSLNFVKSLCWKFKQECLSRD